MIIYLFSFLSTPNSFIKQRRADRRLFWCTCTKCRLTSKSGRSGCKITARERRAQIERDIKGAGRKKSGNQTKVAPLPPTNPEPVVQVQMNILRTPLDGVLEYPLEEYYALPTSEEFA